LAGKKSRVSRGLMMAFVGVLCAAMLTPFSAQADTNLVIGGNAVISYANGDQVRLRSAIGYEAQVVANYDEGTVVVVLDGPTSDAEGNLWYQVSVGAGTASEKVGYIVSNFLALETGVPVQAVPQEQGGAEQAEPPAASTGAVIAIAYVAGTNGDGVRCRAATDAASAVIAVIPEGNTIEITGAPIAGWQPINCAGLGGFISEQFLSWVPPVAEVPAVQEPVVDEAPVVEEPVMAEEPVVEAPVAEEPVVEEPAIEEVPPTEEPVVKEPVVDEPAAEEPAADEGVVEASALTVATGSAIVTGTNGDGVRCRAGADYNANVITVLREGTSVELRGAAEGPWQPVYCGSVAGFAHTDFLSFDGESTTAAAVGGAGEGLVTASAVVTGTGYVAGTNGQGLRCRSAASLSASTITVLPEGSQLSLNGAAQGQWQPVTCAGQAGFVHIDFVSSTGSGTGTGTGSAGTGSGTVSGSATVNTGGNGGLNCRSSGDMSASVITILSNASSVQLRGAANGDWQPVVCSNQNGFVFKTYLNYGSTSAPGNTGTSGDGSGNAGAGFSAGETARVSGTGGGGVRLRSAASLSATVLGVVGEGQTVTVRSGSTGEWVAVTYGGSNGFIHGDYLVKGSGTGTTPGNTNPSSGSGSSGALVNGDRAATTSSLNLRYSASFSAGVAAVAPSGTVVAITGGVSNGFYPVNWDGLTGFMHGDFLVKTTEALSKRGGSAAPSPTAPGGTQSGSVAGNSLVDYAMRYLGYPYVWATAGPSSFDCSGFTYWVVKNVLGRDIGRGLWTQVSAGQAVSRSALQPGDLVFFQNTYTTGLSHVGMYIGNNQFIHAENPSTGVRISDLNSTYYSSRWYGATRLG
jgi:cell wall-associated NlpC family hydrolase